VLPVSPKRDYPRGEVFAGKEEDREFGRKTQGEQDVTLLRKMGLLRQKF